MSIEDFKGGMKEFMNDIISHAELRRCLSSLKEFESALKETDFSKEEIDDFIFKALMFIYVTHNNLQSAFNMMAENIGGDE